MIHHTVVLYHVALMGKQLVVGLGRCDKVCTFPALPVDEVATDGEGVEGCILTAGVVGLEVEHDVEVVHLDDLGVTSDNAAYFVGKDGITFIAFPFLEVVGQGDANAFSLEVVLGIDTSSIVVHHKAGTECLRRVFVNSAFVFRQFLPPLYIFVVDAE